MKVTGEDTDTITVPKYSFEILCLGHAAVGIGSSVGTDRS